MFGNKLNKLNKKVSSAISMVVKTILDLEQANAKYEELKEEVSFEVADLVATQADINSKIKENARIIENFKKLLK